MSMITPERRKSDNMEELKEAVAQLKERQDGFDRKLEENTTATKKVADDTQTLVEWTQAMQGAFKVLEFIGKLAKPIGAISAFAVGASVGADLVKAALKRLF